MRHFAEADPSCFCFCLMRVDLNMISLLQQVSVGTWTTRLYFSDKLHVCCLWWHGSIRKCGGACERALGLSAGHGIRATWRRLGVHERLICPLYCSLIPSDPPFPFRHSSFAALPLPGAVKNSINVPGIGYKIPDLQATAYGEPPSTTPCCAGNSCLSFAVRLLRVVDGTEAACLKGSYPATPVHLKETHYVSFTIPQSI